MDTDEKSELLVKLKTVTDGYLAGESDFTLDLAEWNISFRIKGPKWRGVVDKPLATFVLDLDRKVAEELSRHGVDLPKTEHGLVALRVNEGSMLAFLEGVPDVIDAISKLPPDKQILILFAILIAVGMGKVVQGIMLAYTDGIKEKEQTKRKAIEAQERIHTLRAITESPSRYQLEAPLRGLIGKLGDNDLIELPGAQEGVRKKRVKAELAKSSRSKTSNYYIDGAYTIEGISTKNPAKWTISLNYGQLTFTAALQLSDEDVQSLLADFKEAHAKNRKIAPWLHVTAEINAKGIKKSVVVGIGKARKNSVKMSDALKAEGYDFGKS